MKMAVLEAKDVFYKYSGGRDVLRGVNCAFDYGRLYAIAGRSGSGKSTLLSLLAGLDLPTAGQVLYDGRSTADMDLDRYRREHVAVVYQNFSLFPLLTVLENIMYPMELCGVTGKEAMVSARALAEKVGLSGELYNRFPGSISGGEQQRVAIARALSMNRKLILADEPTGNLDAANSDAVIATLRSLAHDDGCCIVIVTHDFSVMENADAVLRVSDGVLTDAPKSERNGEA